MIKEFKERLADISHELDEEALHGLLQKYSRVIQELNQHLSYELNMARKTSAFSQMIDRVDMRDYTNFFSNEMIPGVHRLKYSYMRFYAAIINFDYSGYPEIGLTKYAEILCTVLQVTAEYKKQDFKAYIRELYSFFEFNKEDAEFGKAFDNLCDYLSLFEKMAKDERMLHNSNQGASGSAKIEPTEHEKALVETFEDSEYFIQLVGDILFQHKINNPQSLRKFLRHKNPLRPWYKVLPIPVLSNLVALIHYTQAKSKFRSIRVAIRKVVAGTKISEEILCQQLVKKFGKSILVFVE